MVLVFVLAGYLVPFGYSAAQPSAASADAALAEWPGALPDVVVRAGFGEPKRVYRFDGCTVDVWDVNLLTKLRK